MLKKHCLSLLIFLSLLLNVKQLNGDSLSAAFICEYLLIKRIFLMAI